MGRIEDECSISEQAARWIVLIKGADTAPLLPALRHWLAQSAAHEREFRAALRAFEELDALPRLSPEARLSWLNGTGSGADNVIQFPTDCSVKVPATRIGSSKYGRSAPVASAAALVLLLIIGGLSGDRAAADSFEYRTATGEQRTVHLSDGSQLILNTNTRVKVALTVEARNIELVEGEILIDVGRDARPLRVSSGNVVIEDIGTRFSVRRRPEVTDLLVERGIVRVDYRVNHLNDRWSHLVETDLKAGEAVSMRLGMVTIAPAITKFSPAEIDRKLSWSHGVLSFAGDTVEQAVEELNRYNGNQIRILKASAKQQRIGGRFAFNDPAGFVQDLRSIGIEGLILEQSDPEAPSSHSALTL